MAEVVIVLLICCSLLCHSLMLITISSLTFPSPFLMIPLHITWAIVLPPFAVRNHRLLRPLMGMREYLVVCFLSEEGQIFRNPLFLVSLNLSES